MADVWLDWGGDFEISATGGLLLADGDDFARQRLERRLFTAVQDYVWHPDYGAGLPQKIGMNYGAVTAGGLKALVRSQLNLEDSVSQNPPPQIAVTQPTGLPGLFDIEIGYTDAQTGASVSFRITT